MGRRLLNSFFQSWQISLSAVRQQEVDENELSLDESMALRKKQVRDRPGSAHETAFWLSIGKVAKFQEDEREMFNNLNSVPDLHSTEKALLALLSCRRQFGSRGAFGPGRIEHLLLPLLLATRQKHRLCKSKMVQTLNLLNTWP